MRYTLGDHNNDEVAVEGCDNVKDLGLGVWFDEINRAHKMLGIIMRNCRHLTISTIMLILFSERELTFTFAICYRPCVCLSVCRL